MILAGRWAYKKYKKNQAAKEALSDENGAHHDELVNGAQAPVLQVQATSPTSITTSGRTRSDPSTPISPSVYSRDGSSDNDEGLNSPRSFGGPPPPSYTAISPSSPVLISQKVAPMVPPPLQSPVTVVSPLQQGPYPESPYAPPQPQHSLPQQQQQQQQQHPAEVPVHGKWVWIPEPNKTQGHDVQLVSTQAPDRSYSVMAQGVVMPPTPQHVPVQDSPAAGLSAPVQHAQSVLSQPAIAELPAQPEMAELTAVQSEAREIDGKEVGGRRGSWDSGVEEMCLGVQNGVQNREFVV